MEDWRQEKIAKKQASFAAKRVTQVEQGIDEDEQKRIARRKGAANKTQAAKKAKQENEEKDKAAAERFLREQEKEAYWADYDTAKAACKPNLEEMLLVATDAAKPKIKSIVKAHRAWLQDVLKQYVSPSAFKV